MKIRHCRTAILLAALALVACDDSGTEIAPLPIPTLDGRWLGAGGGLTLNLLLDEAADSAVTGAGKMSGVNWVLDMRVEGSHAHPDVQLNLRDPGNHAVVFTGTFSQRDRIAGTMSGSGLSGASVTFVRLE